MAHLTLVLGLIAAACAPAGPATITLYAHDGPTARLVSNVVASFNCSQHSTAVRLATFPEAESDAQVGQRVAKDHGIGVLGRYLKDVERAYAREEIVNPPDGGIAIAVAPTATRTAITTSELPALMSGSLADLKVVVTTPKGTQARDLVERIVSGTGRGEAIREVAEQSDALAFAVAHLDAAAIVPIAGAVGHRDVRMLSVDAVEPSIASVSRGDYPLRVFYTIVLPLGDPPVGATAFLSFARSAAGSQAALSTYSDGPSKPCM